MTSHAGSSSGGHGPVHSSSQVEFRPKDHGLGDNDSQVIIVGGGPVGLFAAHALHHSNIPFILLEKEASFVNSPDRLPGLVIYPSALKNLQILGGELWKELERVSVPIQEVKRYYHSDRTNAREDMGDLLHLKKLSNDERQVSTHHLGTPDPFKPRLTRSHLQPERLRQETACFHPQGSHPGPLFEPQQKGQGEPAQRSLHEDLQPQRRHRIGCAGSIKNHSTVRR